MITHRHLVLVGLMGTGKTTVGHIVAHRLGRPLVDTDAAVEAVTGRTVRDIWATDGEAAFRSLETDAVEHALATPQANVVAAAGGVVLSGANRRLLAAPDATVIWLAADPATLVDRVSTGDHRPLLDDDALAALERMARERTELYRSVADVVIDVTDRTPEQVADEVVEWTTGE